MGSVCRHLSGVHIETADLARRRRAAPVETRRTRVVLPEWRRFHDGGVRVTPGPEFVGSQPSRLFDARMDPNPHMPQYAVTADGQRFLGLEPLEGESSPLTFLPQLAQFQPASTSIR
jgi:hypothetical protein